MKINGLKARTTAGVAIAALALSLAACGSSGGGSGGDKGTGSTNTDQPGKGKPAVTMGTKDFAEEFLLGELYAQALRAKGFTVNMKKDIGASEVVDKALTSKKIDMYPEYTGVVYSGKSLANLGDHPKSAKITYDGAKKWEESRGYTMLQPTPFQDADGLAVSKAYAKKYDLKTIGDMKKVGSFTYGGPPENGTRYQGVLGLKQAYGLNQLKFKPLKTGAQYQALNEGQVDSIAVFTTDGQLATGKYAVLTDTKGIFGYQNVAPVVRQSLLKQEGPAFASTLNAVSKLLTLKAIIAMNKSVQIDQKDPAVVAKAFLQANDLV